MIRHTRRLIMALAVCTGLAVPAVAVLPAQGAFAQPICAQSTRVWFGDENNGEVVSYSYNSGTPGGLINAQSGDKFFFTGIVEPNTTITYTITFRSSNNPQQVTFKWNSGGNCVANQKVTNLSDSSAPNPVVADVDVNYRPEGTANNITQNIGSIAFP